MLAGGGVEVELMGPELYLQYKVEQLDLDVKMKIRETIRALSLTLGGGDTRETPQLK